MRAPGDEAAVEVRRATPQEWEDHREIRLEMLREAPDAFWFTYDDEVGFGPERWQEHLGRAWVVHALLDGRVVGSAGLAPHWQEDRDGTAELFGMYVTPAARRRGVGEALVEAVVEEARRQGYGRVVLEVADTNDAAAGLYARCGFTPTGAVQDHPRRQGVHEVEMSRGLDG